MEDCIFIQEKFDKLHKCGSHFNQVATDMFNFINNMVQMRIALGLFGEKTGYVIENQ